MNGIGADIANGAVSALLKALELVPLGVWAILFVAIVVVVFILRYATNWKVDLVGLILAVVIAEGLYLRSHWIEIGYAEAQAQVKAAQVQMEGYKKTEGLILSCYSTTGYVWDRTQGKCLSASGSN